MVALLVGNDTQQVQCLHVARLIRQDRLVESRRLFEAPVLMMLQGNLECICHCGNCALICYLSSTMAIGIVAGGMTITRRRSDCRLV